MNPHDWTFTIDQIKPVLIKYRWITNKTPLDFLLQKCWLSLGEIEDPTFRSSQFPLFLEELAPFLSDTDDLVMQDHFETLTSSLAREQYQHWRNIIISYIPDKFPSFIEIKEHVDMEGLIGSAHAFMGMSPKKIHEILNMTKLILTNIQNYMANDSNLEGSPGIIFEFYEVGCGYGYLLTYLAMVLARPNFKNVQFRFIGYDRNENTIKGAIQRHTKICRAKEWRHSMENISVEYMVKFVDYSKDDIVLHKVCNNGATKIVRTLMALHGCGNLSANTIREYAKLGSPWDGLFLCGCCYHLLSEKFESSLEDPSLEIQGPFGFPLSKRLLESKNKLFCGKYLRNLDCQSPFKDYYLKNFDTILNTQFYCSLFHIYCIRAGLVNNYTGKKDEDLTTPNLPTLGSIKGIYMNSSSIFLKHLLARVFPLATIDEALLESLEKEYLSTKKYLRIVLLFQRWMGFLLEKLIIADRMLFLLQDPLIEDQTVSLEYTFDVKISPRCQIITVFPQKSKREI